VVYIVGASGCWQAFLVPVSWLALWWGYSRSAGVRVWFTVAFGLAPAFGWGLVFVLGSRSGGVRGRIRGGCHRYGVRGRSQKCGGLAVNIDLLGVLVGLQEGE